MQQPMVSIVIPFYSNVSWLDEAIQSVLEQSYLNKEILIINDGSKEDLTETQEKFKKTIKIFNKKNGGPSSARNLGIKLSKGKYIAFLDSDDIWLTDKLKKQVYFMEKNNSVWSQHSYKMFWDESSKSKDVYTDIYSGNVYKDCLISFKIQTSCVMVLRRILIDDSIYFPLEKRYGQDGAFYRLLARDYNLDSMNEILSKFRIRGSNAGFQARIQLNDKAATWVEIREDSKAQELLPRAVILAYKLCYGKSKLLNWYPKFLNGKLIKETSSKLLYLFPYLIFKMYAKKH